METYRALPGSSTFKEAALWLVAGTAMLHWQKGFSREDALKSSAIIASGVIISDLADKIIQSHISTWDLPIRMIQHVVFFGSLALARGSKNHEIFAIASITAMAPPLEDLSFCLMHGRLPQNYQEIPAPIRIARIFLVFSGFLLVAGINPIFGNTWKGIIANAALCTAINEVELYLRPLLNNLLARGPSEERDS